jgi:hypothetical protein
LRWLAVAWLALASGCGGETADYQEPIWLGTGGSGGAGAATSSTTTTTTPWTTTGAGGQGADGGGPIGGAGGGGEDCDLDDAYEPNDTEAIAHSLTTEPIDDCDGSGSQVSGAITSPADVDWFVYRGDDTALCAVNPTAAIVGGSGLRLCQYAVCLSADTTIDDCPDGTSSATSPDGREGCCGSDGFEIDFNCSGSLDEDGHVYVSVDMPDAEPGVCNGYVLSYHY